MTDKYQHPNKLAIAIGAKVRQAREEAGLSQAQLADFVNIRRATITNIENGKSEPMIGTLLGIATVLEKPLEYFVEDAPVPSAWTVPEGSLKPAERLLVLKLRDIGDPKNVLLILNIIETIQQFELENYAEIASQLRERGREASEEITNLLDTVLDELGSEGWQSLEDRLRDALED